MADPNTEMRQYINSIESNSPNSGKCLMRITFIQYYIPSALAGIVEREADYYENLLESADKQLETLTESERKNFDTLVEEHLYKIILEQALNEAVDIKAVLQKWGETAKKASD